MFLKSIEIQGFKSFADKTVLRFGKGVTAVVGPNGSGKSNISDAVRWVLGEQSTKNLRGQSMEDVIFSGTADRRPHGFAEVTLVMDNRDRSLNFDNDEVAVTRRYFRSHESEYLINKAVVRLKDVHELFMDTGLGRDGYSMIGQGKIDTIVRSKSDERRDIFEEASGISRYRYRKIEAERKLAAADDNMLRLKDIMAELEGRVGPLEEQSKKAEKFIELAAIRKKLEIGLWLNSLNQSGDLLKAQDRKITLATALYNEVEGKLQELAATIESSSERYSSINVRIDEMHRTVAALEEEITRLQGDINVHNATIKHNEETVERLRADILELESSDTRSKTEIEGRRATIEAKQSEITALNEKVTALETELNGLISNSEVISRQIEELTKKLNTYSAQISDKRVALVTAQSSIAEIDARNVTLDGSIIEKTAEKDKLDVELKELRDMLKKAEELAEEAANALKGRELIFDSRKQKLEEYKQALDNCRLDIEDKKRRVAILEELERNMEGLGLPVKAVMKEAEHGTLRGIHGPISKLIEVKKEYAIAIETALGASLQHIVVDSENDAKRAIEFLKNQNKGRATFLPISTIRSRTLDEDGLENKFGYVGIASELVEIDKKYEGIIGNLLGKTVVAEDIDAAVTIAKKHGYRFKVVTLDGQVVNAGGSLTGGSLVKNAGILSRAGEIKELSEKIVKLLEKSGMLTDNYNAASAEVSSLEAEILNARSEFTTATEDKIRVSGEIRRVGDLIAELTKSIEAMNGEKFLLDNRKVELQNTVNTANTEIAEIEKLKFTAQTEIDSLSGGRDTVTDRREALTTEITELRIRIMELEKDIESIENSIKLLEEAMSSSGNRGEALLKEIEAVEALSDVERTAIDGLNAQIDERKKDIEEGNKKVTELQLERDSFDREGLKMRQTERDMTAEREKLSGEVARLEERRENMLREYDEIIKRLFDEYELTRTEAEQVAEPVENIPEAKRELQEVKGKIKNLGHVNVAAIEEYKEVHERYVFMKAQMDDLDASRAELNKLIGDLTVQMKEKFSEGFEKIGKNFTKVFTELFGGGHAELVLTDPENILESGIDIVAKLPGKNVPSLEGLSGGEKALIAISIYFAIMMVNAPPFCFLDEVDTALDDINVERFAQYMTKSQFGTQFICVTHRRGTMDSADMLYGVTMQEKGVTKLLQLDVDELIKTLNIENK
ncbi:MAG: chromosome segregation protein SMC [Clostridia bacterium]|nr:chromosome segregation protein SMC [Clostridia bacterium]